MSDVLAGDIKQRMIHLCHSALDTRTLRVELLKYLKMVVPFDYVYFSTTDPATQFVTHSVLVEEPPSWLMSVFLENEFLMDDFNKFNEMLRKHQTVAVLSHATRNNLIQSPRYRDMLVPMAIEDELRVIFVSEGVCWGTLCLHREDATYRFTSAEANYLAQLAPHITAGIRKAILLNNVSQPEPPDGPGTLILSDDLSIIGKTTVAEYWLAELAEMEPLNSQVLPLPIQSVVTALKVIESGRLTSIQPKIRVRTRSGHWLVLYALRLTSSNQISQICVIFEAAQSVEIAPLILSAYQLTKREGEITQSVLRGLSTSEISSKLHISQNTVQDHLKSIFEKVDVNSRGELVARIYTQQHHPYFVADTPLDKSGQFKTGKSFKRKA